MPVCCNAGARPTALPWCPVLHGFLRAKTAEYQGCSPRWKWRNRFPPGFHHLLGRPVWGMTFWFPLEAYGPDAGTMSFVNASHRAGVLGDCTTYGGGDAATPSPSFAI